MFLLKRRKAGNLILIERLSFLNKKLHFSKICHLSFWRGISRKIPVTLRKKINISSYLFHLQWSPRDNLIWRSTMQLLDILMSTKPAWISQCIRMGRTWCKCKCKLPPRATSLASQWIPSSTSLPSRTGACPSRRSTNSPTSRCSTIIHQSMSQALSLKEKIICEWIDIKIFKVILNRPFRYLIVTK